MDTEKTPLRDPFADDPGLRKLPRGSRKWVLWAIVGVLIAGIAAGVTVALTRHTGQANQETKYVLDIDETPVSIRVAAYDENGYSAADSYTLTRKSGTWVQEERPEIAVNQTLADDIAYTTHMQSSRVIAENVSMADMAQYGLAKPVRIITYTFENGSAQTVHLGARYSSDGGFYACLANEHTVHLIPDLTGEALMTPPQALPSLPALMPAVYADGVTRIELNAENEHCVMEKGAKGIDFDAWRFTAPDAQQASDEAVQTLIETLAALTPDEYVGADAPGYGLDKPAVTLTLTSYADTPFTLTVGAVKEGTQSRYCRLNDSDVYLIGPDKLAAFTPFPVYSVLQRHIAYVSLEHLRRLTVTFDAKQIAVMSFNGETEPEKQRFTLNGVSCDGDQFKTVYEALLRLTYEGALTEPVTERATAYTLTLEYTDRTDKLEFLPVDAYRLAVRRNGTARFYTTQSQFDQFMEKLDLFLTGDLQ